jgi:hypothetical protein
VELIFDLAESLRHATILRVAAFLEPTTEAQRAQRGTEVE